MQQPQQLAGSQQQPRDQQQSGDSFDKMIKKLPIEHQHEPENMKLEASTDKKDEEDNNLFQHEVLSRLWNLSASEYEGKPLHKSGSGPCAACQLSGDSCEHDVNSADGKAECDCGAHHDRKLLICREVEQSTCKTPQEQCFSGWASLIPAKKKDGSL